MSYQKPEEIKQSIKLLDYAIVSGYKIDKVKSTVKWARLKNDTTGDKILINTLTGMYFSDIDTNDKGDVIQFKANRLNNNVLVDKSKEGFYQALKELNSYLGTPMDDKSKELLNDKNKFIEKKEKLYSLQDKEWNHETLKDYSFLTDIRKINKETLDHPIFKDRIFNTYFKLKNDHIITNTAFGKYIDDKLVGLEVRNNTIKSIVGNHDGVFITNTSNMNKIDFVFYAESAIDALSYFELIQKHPNFDEKANNYCFISFGGNLYESKVDVIMKELDAIPVHEKTKFISITDNDLDKSEEKKDGKKYDVLMTCALLQKNNFPVELNYENEIYFKLKFDSNLIDQEKLKIIIEKQNEFVDKNIQEPQRYGSYLICKSIEDKKELHFPKKLSLEDNHFKSFLNTIGKEHLYIAHKSKNKDWNDDLKDIKQKKNSTTQPIIKEKKHGQRI